MADEIIMRQQFAERINPRKFAYNALKALFVAKEIYDTKENFQTLYDYITGKKTPYEIGKEELKKDLFIDVDKIKRQYQIRKNKNISFKHKMPQKRTVKLPKGKRLVKRTTKPRVKSSALSKQIKDIKKSINADQSKHTYRERNYLSMRGYAGYKNVGILNAWSTTNIETSLANLRYYNPSTPSTLTTASGATGTFSRNIHIKNINAKAVFRNNAQVPCHVKIYLATPKNDTDTTPIGFYSSGGTDQFVGSFATGQPLMNITDCDQVMDNWNMKLLKSKFLDAGRQILVSYNTGQFDYNPSVTDTHNLLYQRHNKAFCYIVEVEGVVGHDSINSNTEVGTMDCQLDCLATCKTEILYDGGVPLNDFSATNNSQVTFTNAGLTGNKPANDNQAWTLG